MTPGLARPGLIIDLGAYAASAAVVTNTGAWLVPDPLSAENRWRSCLHWDGERVAVGALAEQRRRTDPAGYSTGLKRGLENDAPVLLGARRFRPVEQVVELFGAMRNQAQRQHGPIDRAVLTIPADYLPGDPRRSRMVAAAEAAGFGAVELLAEAVAAVSAPLPGPPFGRGEVVLVYDLGATFEVTLVRVGDDYHEVIGHDSIPDWGQLPPGASPGGAPGGSSAALDQTISCCRDLLNRLGVSARSLTWVLAVGGGCRNPGIEAVLERGLGAPVRRVDEPELMIVRGAAHWLPRSGPRAVPAQTSPERIMPLSFPIPGGSAQLLRWLVVPQQHYGPGDSLARIRLAGGALWELTARSRGVLDQVLVGDGAPVHSGDWLALARQ